MKLFALFAALALVECGSNPKLESCPPPLFNLIDLTCVPIAARTTGLCEVCPHPPSASIEPWCTDAGPTSQWYLVVHDAGACRVDFTFADGGTKSVTIPFEARQRPLFCNHGLVEYDFVPLSGDPEIQLGCRADGGSLE
jgi:hypothetical protein